MHLRRAILRRPQRMLRQARDATDKRKYDQCRRRLQARTQRAPSQSDFFVTTGLGTCLPAARSIRYCRTSVQGMVSPVETIFAKRAAASSSRLARISSDSAFSAIASRIKLCVVLPARSAAQATRAFNSSVKRIVVVDICPPLNGSNVAHSCYLSQSIWSTWTAFRAACSRIHRSACLPLFSATSCRRYRPIRQSPNR
jgi:hypothetical protein